MFEVAGDGASDLIQGTPASGLLRKGHRARLTRRTIGFLGRAAFDALVRMRLSPLALLLRCLILLLADTILLAHLNLQSRCGV